MPYITPAELKSAAYDYQIEQITEGDQDIVLMAISAAEDEVLSYLRPGPKGLAPAYDTALIFSRTGTERSSLLLEMVKNIALWNIVRLANVDMIYDHVKDRYDRAIDWLRRVNKGELLPNLPVVTVTTGTGATVIDTVNDYQVARMGSRPKFNHE